MIKIINIKLYENNILTKEYKNIKSIQNKDLVFNIEETHMKISKKELIRENKEYKFILNFHNKTATYILKNPYTALELNVEHLSYKDNNTIVDIQYKIESNENNMEIIIERDDKNG